MRSCAACGRRSRTNAGELQRGAASGCIRRSNASHPPPDHIAVALTDPLRRKGLTAFEDTGLAGSAQRYLAGTPYEWAAPLLYAVEFAHDCAGEALTHGGRHQNSQGRPALGGLLRHLRPGQSVAWICEHR